MPRCSALAMSQQALAVTGHNVANVSTPGYSRQVVALAPNRNPHLAWWDVPAGARSLALICRKLAA